MSVNDLTQFLDAVSEGWRVKHDVVDNSLVVTTLHEEHLLSLDWLGNQALVPAELDPAEIDAAARLCMAMKVGQGFTWNDYVHRLWTKIVEGYRLSRG